MSELALPQLAVGSHDKGTGMACIMNAISYLNGDHHITDFPTCTWEPLSRIAQIVNDGICSHREGILLCSDCSHKMWMIGARLIGTGDVAHSLDANARQLLMGKMALAAMQAFYPTVPKGMRKAYRSVMSSFKRNLKAGVVRTIDISDFMGLEMDCPASFLTRHVVRVVTWGNFSPVGIRELLFLGFDVEKSKDVAFHKILDAFDAATKTTHRRDWTPSDVVVVSQGMSRTDACSVATGS